MSATLEKRIGLGIKLYVDHDDDGTYTYVAAVADHEHIGGGGSDRGDTSILTDTFKTSLRGQVDPGQYVGTIAYDPNHDDSAIIVGLYESGTVVPFRIVYPDMGNGTVNQDFNGYVDDLDVTLVKGDLVKAKLSVQISGNPNFGV